MTRIIPRLTMAASEYSVLISEVEQRPADVLIPNWSGGRDAALDITVVNPLQVALLARAAVEPGYALSYQHKRKWQKHGEACWAEGMAFHPVVAETLGGWSQPAVDQIRRLGQALARATG